MMIKKKIGRDTIGATFHLLIIVLLHVRGLVSGLFMVKVIMGMINVLMDAAMVKDVSVFAKLEPLLIKMQKDYRVI